MLEFRRKNRIKKILYSPLILLIMGIIFILLIKGVYNVYIKDNISYMNLQKEISELEKIKIRQENLVASLDYLNTEDGIESEIRNKFRAVKDGEKVSVILDDADTSTVTPTSTIKKSFWYSIFH